MKGIFIIHAVSTFFMCGLIWFVQIVHYPLFGQVYNSAFAIYQKENMRSTSLVVIPPMLLELITGCILIWKKPYFLPEGLLWTGLFLLGIIWFSTAILQAPKHKLLASGFNQKIHHALLTTNWIRTIAWSCRSAILIWVLSEPMNV